MFEGRLINFFLQELRSFSALHKKEVIIEPTEPYFKLTFSLDSMKNVGIGGFVQYPVGWGSELQFEFKTDLTYVDQFIKGLKKILTRFPQKI
ncbi:WapI family immunity protein [Cytobacillus oceanisediminis]|uniref:WapI family immunity protein n=1 Tax=Cytobacillus oceanisediminis TaxID=665099 RepID=UPI003BAF8BEE